MTKKASDDSAPASFNVVVELADTAWRIAVPVAALAILGLLIDKRMHSAPWLTLLGMMCGFVIAGLLIKRQIMRGNK